MKLLKSALFITALLTMQPASARTQATRGRAVSPTKARTTPVVVPAPVPVVAPTTPPALPPRDLPSKNSFQYHLQQVRVMKSADVLNNQGVFTPKFETFVKSSGLDPAAMQALMEAGRNLHLPLSGNNNQDLATADYANENINRFIAKQTASTVKAPVDLTAAFYNSKTNLFNQDYLDKTMATEASLTSMPQKDAEKMMISELMPKITNAWKMKNIPVSISQVDAARGQIIRTVEKEFKKWAKPQAAAPQKEWYNGWFRLINTQYLNKFVGDALSSRKSKRQYENELEALEKQVKLQWEEEGITPEQKNVLAPLLNKQLAEAANAIEQKRSLKQELMNEIIQRAPKMNPVVEHEEIINLPYVKKRNPNISAVPKPNLADSVELILQQKGLNNLFKLIFAQVEGNKYELDLTSFEAKNFIFEIMQDLVSKEPNIAETEAATALQKGLSSILQKNGYQFAPIAPEITRQIYGYIDEAKKR